MSSLLLIAYFNLQSTSRLALPVFMLISSENHISLSTNKCETKQPSMWVLPSGQKQQNDVCNGIGGIIGVSFQTVDKIGDPVKFGNCPVLKNTAYYFNINNGAGDGMLKGISSCLVGETCAFVQGLYINWYYDDQGNLISN